MRSVARGALTMAIAASLAAGCGGSAKPAPATPDNRDQPAPIDAAYAEQLADALIEVLGTMAQISLATDCQQMGTQLGALFDRSEPLIAQTRQLDDDPESARLVRAAMDARAEQVAPLVEAMGPGLVRCRQDASVVAAMARMPTL